MNSHLIVEIIGFGIVAIASFQIAGYLRRYKFPLITGLIVTGIIAGSSLLNFISREALEQLQFLNEIALAIIAFSAGSELYLKELRSRLNSIKWMTISQLVVTFVFGAVAVFYLSDWIPFMKEMSNPEKWAVASLFGVIFVARSPSSAIAIINELRARGPFTKTTIGVTVVKDVLVIILFTLCITIAEAVINGKPIDFSFVIVLMLELFVSFAAGLFLGKLLVLPFSFNLHRHIKKLLIILIGYGVYVLSNYIKAESMHWFGHQFALEPLLICILGGFVLTNYTKHRIEFADTLAKVSPSIFIVFFTLAGASLSLQVFLTVVEAAFIFFFIRIATLFIGSFLGVVVSRDDARYRFISWMPFVTQAGVALGLTTIIAKTFPAWGIGFETIIIAMVVINQLVGPPMFKWAISFVGESHLRHATPSFDGVKDAYIFGLESQSIALARQLKSNNWQSKIITLDRDMNRAEDDLTITSISDLSVEELQKLELEKADAVVCMLSDQENLVIAEMVYERIGTREVIVRLNERENMEKFHKLGALIIDPSTAMVSLLDHFVRSPNATSLLLGMDRSQDTQDIEITNRDIHGMTLRDLRLPTDVIILSVKRKGQMIISHGYTRLRLKDIVTMVGSPKSLVEVRTKFGGY
ncbi:MAG TPA: cation:proton antiporter [Cyclobacteriaceae bacterium]|nr:cation:proton antiporter [Cyclobacteriaceae bacterium]